MAKKVNKPSKPAKAVVKKNKPAKVVAKKAAPAKAARKSASSKGKSLSRRKKLIPQKPFLPRKKIIAPAPIQKFVLKSALPMNLREVDEKPLTTTEVNKFRDILTTKRDDLLTVVQRKKEQEFQAVDEEIGDEADIATRSVEREMLFELTDSEKQTLDMVEAALRKMEKGVYGLCESCQKPIGRLRIDVMPWARYCIRCQSLQEVPAGE